MQTCAEKIQEIIRDQGFSSEDTNLWDNLLNGLPDRICVDILAFIEKTLGGVRVMTDNLREKKAAIEAQDMTKWDELLKKDAEYIKSLKR